MLKATAKKGVKSGLKKGALKMMESMEMRKKRIKMHNSSMPKMMS